MAWTITYYSDAVQQEINRWPVGLRAVYTRITERMVIFGPHLGMPYTRSLGDGLFEIRTKGRDGLGRAIFCTLVGQKIVILHSFIKKSKRTPLKELNTARRRLKEVRHENP
jgi:phage-related protein